MLSVTCCEVTTCDSALCAPPHLYISTSQHKVVIEDRALWESHPPFDIRTATQPPPLRIGHWELIYRE